MSEKLDWFEVDASSLTDEVLELLKEFYEMEAELHAVKAKAVTQLNVQLAEAGITPPQGAVTVWSLKFRSLSFAFKAEAKSKKERVSLKAPDPRKVVRRRLRVKP